jgi:acyl-CoA dehydrogenase
VVADVHSPVAGDPDRSTHLPLFAEEHDALRETARDFVATEITPHVDAWEAAEDFPRELFRRIGGAGLFGMKFEPAWGGSGPDLLAAAVWVEELARGSSGGIAGDLGAHSELGCLYVARAGTDEQRDRYLRSGIAGETIGALAITEPGAGSDVAGIRTRATRDGDDWILDGSKVFITNGAWCDWVVVAAKTDPAAGHSGITLFIVDAGIEGFGRQRMKMLGWRTSHTGELHLDGVRVPADAVLGDVGRGFYEIMRNFVWERLTMALGAVAGSETALAGSIAYAQQREAFGRPIARFQVWRHRFADLATEIELGRSLTYHALRQAVDGDPDAVRSAAMAKLVTQRMAVQVADEAVQVHGGYGYITEFPAERWLRDARLGPIGGGTDEIMREIIARSLELP